MDRLRLNSEAEVPMPCRWSCLPQGVMPASVSVRSRRAYWGSTPWATHPHRPNLWVAGAVLRGVIDHSGHRGPHSTPVGSICRRCQARLMAERRRDSPSG